VTRPEGRGTAELLRGHELPVPMRPVAEPETKPEKVNRSARPRRGRNERGLGWAAVEAPLSTLRTTTDQVGGLYPLLATPGMPPVGALIGYDALSGGAFYCHPVEWVLRAVATNPNILVFGEPGRGKSSTIAAFLLRMMPFGVKTLIAGDVKGEYSSLVRALGQEPISLGYGQRTRINPLDLGPLQARWDRLSDDEAVDALNDLIGRWSTLLAGLTEAGGRPVTPTDTEVLSHVLRDLTGITAGNTRLRPITIPDVHRALTDADERLWQAHRFGSRQHFLDETRLLTDSLGTLVNGPLKGLFDEPTNITVDWNAPIQSLDVSGLEGRGDTALAVAMTCLGSWSRSATDLRTDGELRIIVRDEIWRQIRLGAGMVAAVDAELRLSRAQQIISILAAHKPGDMLTVGDSGSQSVNIAKGLLALCDTRLLMGQATAVADDLASELQLSDREQELITGWCNGSPGRGLWKVKRSGFQVQAMLTPRERQIFDTNAQLRSQPSQFTNPDDSSRIAEPGGR
jgi:hypothetical protein